MLSAADSLSESLGVLKLVTALVLPAEHITHKSDKVSLIVCMGEFDLVVSPILRNFPQYEVIEDELYLEYIKRFFDEKVYNRGIMYYLQGMTQSEIADIEGVSATAVRKSVVKFKRVMSELYKNKS